MNRRACSRLSCSAILVSLAAAAVANGASFVLQVQDETRAQFDLSAIWLREMHEPILSANDSLGRFKRRFRMLAQPSFQPSYAMQIDETSSGARFNFVVRDPRSDRPPVPMLLRRGGYLSPAERRRLDAVLRSRAFRALPSQEEAPQDEIWLDGTLYMFELVDRSGYRRIDRSRGLDPPLFVLVRLINQIRSRALAQSQGDQGGG